MDVVSLIFISNTYRITESTQMKTLKCLCSVVSTFGFIAQRLRQINLLSDVCNNKYEGIIIETPEINMD